MTDKNPTSDAPVRVLIVDDHPTLREGLGHSISAQPDMEVCGEAGNVDEALQQIASSQPDVVIVDIALKHSDGLELIKMIKTRHPRLITLAHSMYDDRLYANRCLRAGAMGYVNKESPPTEVIRAIREVVAGRVYLNPELTSEILSRTARGAERHADPVDLLTDRQLEIFRLIGEGQSTTQIAKSLHISVHTVETHRENIKQKLNVGTAAELARRAVLWASENR